MEGGAVEEGGSALEQLEAGDRELPQTALTGSRGTAGREEHSWLSETGPKLIVTIKTTNTEI